MKTIWTTLAAAVLLLNGCGKGEKSVKLETFPVRVVEAKKQLMEEKLVITGSLKARDEATLYSRVPGKLKENRLKEGEPVKKGEAVSWVERDEVGVVYEPAPVPSTLSGVVGRIYLDRGQNITLTTPVALVVDDSEVIAQADMPERYTGRAVLGQYVETRVDAYPKRVFQGRISRLSPVVNPQTRTALLEVTLDNKEKALRSGMFAELTVVVSRKEGALVVPASAILEGTPAIAFVAKDGIAHRREITLGLQTDTLIEVKSGLEPGEAVIASGLFALQDGSPVEIESDVKR